VILIIAYLEPSFHSPPEMDIHNICRRYENAIRNLDRHSGISGENKEKITEFLGHCSAQDLSIARRLFYLQRLTIIAAILSDKRFVETNRISRSALRVGLLVF
jgi:hypothetical protein